MSPSSGGLLCNGGGLISGHMGSNHSTQIPTISVSVQTEPQFWSNVGLANTSTLLANGVLQHQKPQVPPMTHIVIRNLELMNGLIFCCQINGNGMKPALGGLDYSNNYSSATMPHLSGGGHVPHHFVALQSNNLGGGCPNSGSGHTHQVASL